MYSGRSATPTVHRMPSNADPSPRAAGQSALPHDRRVQRASPGQTWAPPAGKPGCRNPGKKSDFRNSSQAPMRLGDQPCYQHTAVRMQHARGAPPTGRTPQPWLNHRRGAMADPSLAFNLPANWHPGKAQQHPGDITAA